MGIVMILDYYIQKTFQECIIWALRNRKNEQTPCLRIKFSILFRITFIGSIVSNAACLFTSLSNFNPIHFFFSLLNFIKIVLGKRSSDAVANPLASFSPSLLTSRKKCAIWVSLVTGLAICTENDH